MIHKFIFDDTKIVLDVNSGSIHVVSQIVWDIIDDYLNLGYVAVEQKYTPLYPAEQLKEALGELHGLQEQGLLGAVDNMKECYSPGEPLLKALCLHVAHSCNLACRYCFAQQGRYHGEKALMGEETALRAIDFLVERSGSRRHCEIDFFGGEPLLNFPVVRAVVKYARQREKECGKEFRFTLTTNALLLDLETLNFCNDNSISLVLSVDGREEIHNRMRPLGNGAPSYHQVMQRIKQAVGARGQENYVARGTITAFNTDFTHDIKHLVQEGLQFLSLEPVVAPETEEYALKPEHLEELKQEYETLARLYLEDRQSGRFWSFFHFNIDLDGGPCLPKRLTGCGAGSSYLAVTPEGDLYPCHQFVGQPKFLLGNLAEGTVCGELVTQFQQAHIYNKKECESCWAKFFCSGGCHANAFMHGGSLLNPYKLGCELMKKRLECALYIKVKEQGLLK